MPTLTTKQHDTKIRFWDRPKIDGVRVLLSEMDGCTVAFILKSLTKLVKAPAVLTTDPLDVTLAYFYYDPVADDVADVGDYQQEWEVTYSSGKPLTFPNTTYNDVKIIADLG